MHTYAMQILLHFQTSEPEDHERTESFLRAVRELAEQHGISFDDFQSMRLLSESYRIRRCDRCGDLTVNDADVEDDIETMLPDFWAYVRRGIVNERQSICNICSPVHVAP
jgi:hypothetical protein